MNKQDLVYKNEKTLFAILAPLAILVWAVFIIGTFGIGLLVLLFIFVMYIFIQSGFIAYLRGTGAIVSARQFPDLEEHLTTCLQKLDMRDKRPEMILLHADGIFNALATRFLRRSYVVLFSDVVDALQDNPESLKFYIGHELGHLRRNHLLWDPVLAPVSWLPLLGAGYARARETTCDLHGLYCCHDREAAMRAMAALAVGGQRWKSLDFVAYLDQVKSTGDFWMSFHEIIGNYPWLVKRMARVEGETPIPRRNPFAWIFGACIPRLSFVSLAIIYAIIIIPIYISDMQKKKNGVGALESTYEYSVEEKEYMTKEYMKTLPHPKTQAEYEAIPQGSDYVDSEDGQIYTKE